MNQNHKKLSFKDKFKKEFKITKPDLLALPNILCYIRLLLIPLFVMLYIKAETSKEYYFAGFIVVLASFTDFLDGFIARKLDMITEFGKVLDPLADKLMQLALLFVLLIEVDYMYILVAIFLVKEILMAIAAIKFVNKGKKLDGAKWFGKVSTAVFYVVMLILIISPNIDSSIQYSLMTICGFFLLLSFTLYGREYYYMYREIKAEEIQKNP